MEIIGIFGEVFKYIASPELLPPSIYGFYSVLRIIFTIVTLFFIGVLIFVFFASDYKMYRYQEWHSEYKKRKPYWGIKLNQNWDDVLKQANDDNESERKLAIIEADDMINDALSQMGYSGEDLIAKLDGLNKEIIPKIEELKTAHRLKRDLVCDPNKSISKEEAQRVLKDYEETFKDLQIF